MKPFIIIAVIVFALIILSYMAWGEEIEDVLPYLIQIESNNNPHAVGEAGERGLCQLSEIVFKEYLQEQCRFDITERGSYYTDFTYCNDEGVVFVFDGNVLELYEPEFNKHIATWYLRRLRDHYLKKGVQIFADPFVSNAICVSRWDKKVSTYRFMHTRYIKCADDYKLALILSAYNGGITRLRKNNYDISKMPRSTREYVKKIMKLYHKGKVN